MDLDEQIWPVERTDIYECVQFGADPHENLDLVNLNDFSQWECWALVQFFALCVGSCYVNVLKLGHCDSPAGEGDAAPVLPGNNQPLPPGHQQQDVPVPGHS